jgi:hypothetical protein
MDHFEPGLRFAVLRKLTGKIDDCGRLVADYGFGDWIAVSPTGYREPYHTNTDQNGCEQRGD